MKQFLLRLVILAGISFLPTVSNAQLREKAEELLSTTLGNDPDRFCPKQRFSFFAQKGGKTGLSVGEI